MNSFESASLSSLFGATGNGSLTSSQQGTLLVKMRDDDGDGTLSSREAGISATRFKETDADGDGKLTADEIARQQAGRKTASAGSVDLSALARSLLAMKDTDRNGGMTAKESGLSAERFDVADTNRDGEIDAGELATHMEKGMAQQGAPTQSYRSVALEGAMSLLGGNYSSPWYQSPQKDGASDWFG